MSPAVAGGDRRITDLRLAEVASETISKTNQQTKLKPRYNKKKNQGGREERMEKGRE